MKWFRYKADKYLPLFLRRVTAKRLLNMGALLFDIRLRRTRTISRPIVARINTYPFCNLKCGGCALQNKRNNINFSEKVMKFADYKKVIDKIADHTMLVILYDEGEPLLNKDILRIIEYTNKRNISTYISTNFSFPLTEAYLTRLIHSGLDKLVVAIDGISQEVYGKYRVGGDVETVKSNLETLVRLKAEYGLGNPVIYVQFIDLGFNIHEKEAVESYAKKVGVKGFYSFKSSAGSLSEYITSEEGLSPREKIQCGCLDLWITADVSNDGNLYPCDYGEDHQIRPVGSMYEQPFEALWNSEYMQSLRGSFKRTSEGLLFVQCERCPLINRFPFFLR